MRSNGAMFQQEKTLLMVLLEVWMQPEYIVEVADFKDFLSYGRIRTVTAWPNRYNAMYLKNRYQYIGHKYRIPNTTIIKHMQH